MTMHCIQPSASVQKSPQRAKKLVYNKWKRVLSS